MELERKETQTDLSRLGECKLSQFNFLDAILVI